MKRLIACIALLLGGLTHAQQPVDRAAFEPICTAPLPGGSAMEPQDAELVIQGKVYEPCTARLFMLDSSADIDPVISESMLYIAVLRARLGITKAEELPLDVVQAPFDLGEYDTVMRLSGEHHILLWFTHLELDYVTDQLRLVTALYPVAEPDLN